MIDESNAGRYFAEVKPENGASDLIASLAASGRYHFTMKQAAAALGGSAVATRAALRRLRQKGAIAVPYRGFHVIVPPEYRRIGCLPADQFIPQLMAHLGLSYYAALLSAAQHHGAAHQHPQVFQVMVQRNRPPIECGEVRVGFIARRNVDEVPLAEYNTPRGSVRVSTPEATAFDLVGYPDHAGGLDNAATVLTELAERLSAERLAALAPLSPVAWSQRLGHMLDLIGEVDRAEPLADYVRRTARETVPLDLRRPVDSADRDARWKLAVNVKLAPDL